ncbi:MAG: alpha/beta hydrolase [Beijerinckiaceae bacterium]
MSEGQQQTPAAVEPGPPSFHALACLPGVELAWRRVDAAGSDRPGIVWLGGFRSDMLSTKAERIAGFAREHGRGFLRFDYSGHGESGGRFEDGTIGGWTAESVEMIRALSSGPQILVGSSMGGWIALLAARALAAAGEADRLAGMVLIAPAVDFTEELMWAAFAEDIRQDLLTKGVWMRPTQYAPEPYAVTMRLIEEGRNNLLFGQPVRSHCPVQILQGMEDPDVPWRHAMKLVEHMAGDPVAITLVKDGDHRLSRDEDIARLLDAIANLPEQAGAGGREQ